MLLTNEYIKAMKDTMNVFGRLSAIQGETLLESYEALRCEYENLMKNQVLFMKLCRWNSHGVCFYNDPTHCACTVPNCPLEGVAR